MIEPSPAPIFFGPTHRPLFGWLHQAAAAAPRDLGVVICNPFGYEAICAHRTLRHLAERTAMAGYPVLRFDYDGTGNSTGDDLEPDRVAAWISSIGHAIDTIRAQGATRVVLVGVRIGAALASHAALRRDDVQSLIFIAPVTGKAFVRELRALQLAMNQAGDASTQDAEDIQESAGFCLTVQTRNDLSGLLFDGPSHAVDTSVLVLDRDDLPATSKVQTALEGRGLNVTRRPFSGYVGMMSDSHEVVVPDAMIDDVVQWVRQLPSSAYTPIPLNIADKAAIPVAYTEGSTNHVEEQGVFFDAAHSLFGIVSRSDQVAPSGKCVLLINSGAVHHVGPNRLYTALARRWALEGHVVLRLDLAGLGDSRHHADEAENIVYGPKAVLDLNEALQYLRSHYDVRDFYAIGLCAGAYHSLKLALHATLAGVIAINPLTFFWKEGMVLKYPEHRVADDALRYRRTAFQPSAWLKLLSGGVNVRELLNVLALRLQAVARSHWRNIARTLRLPLQDDLGSELLKVSRQHTHISFVFSGGDAGQELLRLQAGSVTEKLRRKRTLDLAIIDGANHTFTDRRTRTELIQVLTKFLNTAPSRAG